MLTALSRGAAGGGAGFLVAPALGRLGGAGGVGLLLIVVVLEPFVTPLVVGGVLEIVA